MVSVSALILIEDEPYFFTQGLLYMVLSKQTKCEIQGGANLTMEDRSVIV